VIERVRRIYKPDVKEKFDWLLAVAADRRLAHISEGVALVLAAKYVNSKSGLAWPSIATLAKDLNVHRSSVQRGLKQLIAHGYLQQEEQRWASNSYSLRVAPLLRSRDATRGGSRAATSGGSRDATQTLEENYKNGTRESPAAKAAAHSGPRFKKTSPRAGASSKRKTVWPEEWQCSSDELETAQHIAGWDEDRSYDEFDRFRDWCLQKNMHSADWPASWRQWIRNGKEYEEKKSQQQESGYSGMLRGIKNWYDRQPRQEEE
jgi:hypothetical protein